jgi:hypothetical protein
MRMSDGLRATGIIREEARSNLATLTSNDGSNTHIESLNPQIEKGK